jgi:hypothetical protein
MLTIRTMHTSKKTFPGAGRFDSINSTYKHEIILKNEKILSGYSKGLLQNETPDKTVLLQKVILRLINNGYLKADRTLRIDFYLKSFLAGGDELILSLEPLSYVVIGDQFLMNERLNSFLKRLYMNLRQGKVVTKDLADKRKVIFEDDIFNLKKKIFDNENDLREYCIKKIKEGHEEQRAKHYFYSYKDKYLTNSSQNAQKR